jgi:hypothetical protein
LACSHRWCNGWRARIGGVMVGMLASAV